MDRCTLQASWQRDCSLIFNKASRYSEVTWSIEIIYVTCRLYNKQYHVFKWYPIFLFSIGLYNLPKFSFLKKPPFHNVLFVKETVGILYPDSSWEISTFDVSIKINIPKMVCIIFLWHMTAE